MTRKWLSIVGIGEDGLQGLSAIARSLIEQAEVIVGGDRHLAMLPPNDQRQKIAWTSPISSSIAEIIRRRGESVCVLASGDPFCYGIGVTLTRQIPLEEITIIPAPSTFSLACAKLGWSFRETETLSLCGRPASLLHSYIYPNAKLLILSEGKDTPATVADILTNRGYGGSKITVLEHLGGIQERIVEGIAADWDKREIAPLNAIAVECIANAGVVPLPRLPGLPDHAYHHDGQLTKSEVRAVTLAKLAPIPGELLWDVGAGCGSISIEWMRTDSRCQAIAIEQNSSRLGYIANNAAALGTPHLKIISGKAPSILQNLPTPDAIFIGGGVTAAGLFDICWNALRPGGRLVANVVTVEGEQILFKWYEQVGGSLTRIAIQRAEPIGKFLGWRAMSPVTQWIAIKPENF
ncbi:MULTISPECIES: precorrin-6y C5,15-methyltransferase (decarboxylating) subunit CbiE [unclassified Nodularia (in: cyanobacteria)]|uniref:precorrin-6y C5,15-methyltransferase (decarboxylating) subunit CbiE n=1 Tax=unclassified Nodularia (in: cyanobacteria) TaxID=2656917 RepID=UPI0018801BC9|nr:MULTISPECIES: precorrin-6y C5,15-methyltransferase (decarboxylating) subunit CbiE [unclassified Nodularia (in: cyanobacteria)]MBE9201973.1 precorrin-6y C5,15-methyltransferase (decarboxylating) subunit CbiE [Nodularia sp. LEGE 06071]MCC2693856.1 precorrin-6y C5,15-methyltransferase (decarboxylating) subunit CbiE [Nodularia sp. LEGE 04288]